MPQVMLSNLTVDFEQFVTQFEADLVKRDPLADLSPSGIGVTIIEWLSSIGAYETMAIKRALQESMLDTARQRNSIITIARMLGIHIIRKTPAWTVANISNNNPGSNVITIPSYTQFKINGRNFFNRDAIFFEKNDITTVKSLNLYEGTVTTEQIIAQGGDFQRYYIGDPSLTISELDVQCEINNVLFTRTTEALWKLGANETKFYENTLASNEVEIVFGNSNPNVVGTGLYGVSPNNGDVITFTYAVTSGAAGNYYAVNEKISSPNFGSITGVTVSPCQNGSDEKDINFYRVFAPMLFSANTRMVTRDDYKAVALTYSDPISSKSIVDCTFRGQAEIDPTRLEWMNAIEYTIISKTTTTNPDGSTIDTYNDWTDQDHKNFINWIKTVGIYQTRLQQRDPQKINLNIKAIVYCKPRANLTLISDLINTSLTSTFGVLKVGSLGYSIYLSDITTAIKNSHQDIEFVELKQPNINIIVNDIQFVQLANIDVSMEYTTRTSRQY